MTNLTDKDFPGWHVGTRAIWMDGTIARVQEVHHDGVHVRWENLAGTFFYGWDEIVPFGFVYLPDGPLNFAPLTEAQLLVAEELATRPADYASWDVVYSLLGSEQIEWSKTNGLHLHLRLPGGNPADICTQCREGQ